MWVVWAPDGTRQRRAAARLRRGAGQRPPATCGSRSRSGTSSKFATPGVGNGRVYVGTRDGHVLGLRRAGRRPRSRRRDDVPDDDGRRRRRPANVKLTVSGTVHVDVGQPRRRRLFSRAAAGRGVPGRLRRRADDRPCRWTSRRPRRASVGGTLTVVTDKGTFSFSPDRRPARRTTAAADGRRRRSCRSAARSSASELRGHDHARQRRRAAADDQRRRRCPSAPFSVDDPPAPRARRSRRATRINVTVHYAPTAVGDFDDELDAARPTAATRRSG